MIFEIIFLQTNKKEHECEVFPEALNIQSSNPDI